MTIAITDMEMSIQNFVNDLRECKNVVDVMLIAVE